MQRTQAVAVIITCEIEFVKFNSRLRFFAREHPFFVFFCGTPARSIHHRVIEVFKGRILDSLQSDGQRPRGKTMQAAEGWVREENHESRGEERLFEEMEGV